ncbi:MAG: DUF4396 domain-containing protein [Dehalococcoidia bacterium]
MEFLTLIAWTSIVVAVGCSAIVAIDELVNQPKMMPIMRLVWPITCLWSGLLGLAAYWWVGRGLMSTPREERPERVTTAVAASHCGSGCTAGDFAAESVAAVFPLVLFGHAIFGTWVMDFVAALVLGIAFQYASIPAKRAPSRGRRLLHAVQADAASLTAWQVGMYGWMAIVVFVIAGHELSTADPVFWFSMQAAMVAGFCTSYPVNVWLLRKGIKEPM